jgi:hypothetical protein
MAHVSSSKAGDIAPRDSTTVRSSVHREPVDIGSKSLSMRIMRPRVGYAEGRCVQALGACDGRRLAFHLRRASPYAPVYALGATESFRASTRI